MFIDDNDCATGLCTAINDQSGPEYKDISRLFALSNLLDFANGNASASSVSAAAVNAAADVGDSSQRISVIQVLLVVTCSSFTQGFKGIRQLTMN